MLFFGFAFGILSKRPLFFHKSLEERDGSYVEQDEGIIANFQRGVLNLCSRIIYSPQSNTFSMEWRPVC